MNLSEFVAEYQKRILAFEVYWKRNAIINPEMYPANLNPGEWEEMLSMFDIAIEKNES